MESPEFKMHIEFPDRTVWEVSESHSIDEPNVVVLFEYERTPEGTRFEEPNFILELDGWMKFYDVFESKRARIT